MNRKFKSEKRGVLGGPHEKKVNLASFENTCRHVFRVVRDGILLVDAKTGSVEESNPSLLRMLGLAKKDLMKIKIWKIGFLDGPLSSQAAFGRLKRGSQSCYEHLRILSKRGRRLDVDLECAFFRAGDVDVVQFNIRDVTERLRLETALREREERYGKIFNNSFLGIAIISLDLRISQINRTFSRITGYGEDDMKRLTLTDIAHPSHLSAIGKILRAAKSRANGDYHLESRYVGKRGNVIWTNTHVSAVCGTDGKPAYLQVIIEDISERKEMEARLTERNLRNIEREKTIQKLKDEFIFIAAHELRTPVTAIGWAMDLLDDCRAKRGIQEPDVMEAMDILRENTKRLSNLVTELLEVSRIEYGTFRVVPVRTSIAAVIDRALESVGSMVGEKSVTVRDTVLPKAVSDVFADPMRVYEVLTNLLTNAIKFNHVGGSVTVRVREGRNELHVSVEDTGCGIGTEEIPKLFHRFYRIENDAVKDVPGTGLGLFIAKQVIERMGGRIWADSEGRGKGSTFTFSLPKAK
ncbi:PAS domain S-box protein [Candidatus Uhrbacteria bacterium]|nr:PAS domain S-box protein [Candidatus Uhrbacteria bacterium]